MNAGKRLQLFGVLMFIPLGLYILFFEQKVVDLSLPIAPSASKLSYVYVQSHVIGPHCYRCHGDSGIAPGEVRIDTYANVRSNLERIRTAVFERKRMPPADIPELALSRRQLAILKAWIDAGAPEFAPGDPAVR